MRNFIFIIGFYLLVNLILISNISGQYCYLDSINDKKLQYNQSGKLDLIYYKGIVWPPFDSATYYNKLNYNNDSLLETVVDFVITYSGDTSTPWITRTYEYENGLISRIWKYSSVIIDDFVWDNNKIIEYKYYYFSSDSTIDSSLTRITQFTYLNNNIHHFLYKEIASGYIYSNYYFYYDNKINPYYESEVSLVDGNLLDYSCQNNWISTSSGMSRTITYNSQNFPIYIYTDANNGNFSYDTISYNCTNSIEPNSPIIAFEVEFIPNPAAEYFVVKNNNNLKINEVKIFNLNGLLLVHENYSEIINVNELKPGIYIVECRYGDITLRKKIIIYTS